MTLSKKQFLFNNGIFLQSYSRLSHISQQQTLGNCQMPFMSSNQQHQNTRKPNCIKQRCANSYQLMDRLHSLVHSLPLPRQSTVALPHQSRHQVQRSSSCAPSWTSVGYSETSQWQPPRERSSQTPAVLQKEERAINDHIDINHWAAAFTTVIRTGFELDLELLGSKPNHKK